MGKVTAATKKVASWLLLGKSRQPDRESPWPALPDTMPGKVFYDRLVERFELHVQSAARRSPKNKCWCERLRVLLPLTSFGVAVTVAVAGGNRAFATTIALFAGLLTSLNSSLAPCDKYLRYSSAAIELHDLRRDLEAFMRAPATADLEEEKVIAMLGDFNARLSGIAATMSVLPTLGQTRPPSAGSVPANQEQS